MSGIQLLAALSLLMAGGLSAEAEGPFFEQRVFLERGARPGAFAIPKLVCTPGGTALAVAQDRGGGDWGKPIVPMRGCECLLDG